MAVDSYRGGNKNQPAAASPPPSRTPRKITNHLRRRSEWSRLLMSGLAVRISGRIGKPTDQGASGTLRPLPFVAGKLSVVRRSSRTSDDEREGSGKFSGKLLSDGGN